MTTLKLSFSCCNILAKMTFLPLAGIPKETTREELAELFKPYGEIIQSKILVDQYTGYSKGAGFILFR